MEVVAGFLLISAFVLCVLAGLNVAHPRVNLFAFGVALFIAERIYQVAT